MNLYAYRIVFCVCLFLLAGSEANAQATIPVKKPAAIAPRDTSTPKLIVQFGTQRDSSKTLVSNMKQGLKNELKVTDMKGGSYTILKFSFAWRKKDLTDDFKTGIPKTIFNYNQTSQTGDSHIPSSWQKEIQEMLQAGEELYFFEILAQNTRSKRLVKPPSLRLFVL